MNLGGYNLLGKLADQSTAYLLLVIALLAIAYLFRYILKEKDKEILDKESANIVLRSVDETMKELIVEIEHNHSYDHQKTKK